MKAFMSWREVESLLCSINQPLNAAKRVIYSSDNVSVYLKTTTTSFDLHCSINVCYKMTEDSILSDDDNNNKKKKSRKDWHMPAEASEAAWLGLFTALINGRLSWWHKQSWQQQKPQTVANPSSSHYHRCMRGAILPFLPDLSLWAFRGWTKIWNS